MLRKRSRVAAAKLALLEAELEEAEFDENQSRRSRRSAVSEVDLQAQRLEMAGLGNTIPESSPGGVAHASAVPEQPDCTLHATQARPPPAPMNSNVSLAKPSLASHNEITLIQFHAQVQHQSHLSHSNTRSVRLSRHYLVGPVLCSSQIGGLSIHSGVKHVSRSLLKMLYARADWCGCLLFDDQRGALSPHQTRRIPK